MAFKLVGLFILFCVVLGVLFLTYRAGVALSTRCKHNWKLVHTGDSELNGQLIGKIEVYQCGDCKKSMRLPIRFIK